MTIYIHYYSAYISNTFNTSQTPQNRALNSVCIYICNTKVTLFYLFKIRKTNTKDIIK